MNSAVHVTLSGKISNDPFRYQRLAHAGITHQQDWYSAIGVHSQEEVLHSRSFISQDPFRHLIHQFDINPNFSEFFGWNINDYDQIVSAGEAIIPSYIPAVTGNVDFVGENRRFRGWQNAIRVHSAA